MINMENAAGEVCGCHKSNAAKQNKQHTSTGIRDAMAGCQISTADYNYNNYCWHRLPCGICKLTNSICPIKGGNNNPVITYTTTSALGSGLNKYPSTIN